MKNITIAGNIGKSAELRQAGNSQVAGFSVAVSNGRDKDATWFDCSLWGTRGESLAQYLTKGSKVCVTGELKTREHDGKTYLKIDANDVTLMGKSGGNGGGSNRQNSQGDYQQDQSRGYGNQGGQSSGSGSYDLDDGIPF